MCGRFVVARSLGEMLTIFEADEIIGEVEVPSYNIAPTHNIAILVDRPIVKPVAGEPIGELRREIHSARWGLVPRWSSGPTASAPLINGRIETLDSKPSFKDALIRRRCVIPASGYYEWHVREDGTKQPFYIHAGEDGILAMAGLYEWWLDESKSKDDPTRWLLSATTITKHTAPELAHIHDRNPLLLGPEMLEAWLDPSIDGDRDLLDAAAAESEFLASEVEFYPVGSAVGQVRNNEPSLIKPL